MLMDVSIIIVNWNSKQYLPACIESICRHTTKVAYEIIVVDSGSFDGCGELLSRQFSDVRFIQCKTNVGFAAANNLAVDLARADCLLFLNPDTELTSPAVDRLFEHLAEHPKVGAVGCKLFNRDGSVQTSCVQPFPTIINQLLNIEVLRQRLPHWRVWGTASLLGTAQAAVPAQVVSGACLMVQRSAFEHVGRFSEEYFMYAEDLDLCHKLHKAGYANCCLPNVTARHFGGGSSEQAPSAFSSVMMRESIWRFLQNSRGLAYGAAYRLSVLVAALLRIGLLGLLVVVDLIGRRRDGVALRLRSLGKWRAILAWSLRIKTAVRPA